MAAIYGVTVGVANVVARPAKARNFLGLYNQSANAVYVAFDTPAVASATAGQITLQPATGQNQASVVWIGDAQQVPAGAINVISGTAGSALTIVEA